MRTYFEILILALLAFQGIHAQEVPAPAPAQEHPVMLVGGTIHVGNGEVIENGRIRFENGKIAFVGTSEEMIPQDDVEVIDITGKHVYPGLIAPNTTLGLTEIGSVRATHDYNEVGEFNPNVRAIVAYNTDSRITPTVRSNGILTAEIAPRGGFISGASSVVQLDAWNWEDAAYKTDIGIHLNWANMFNRKGWWAEQGGIEENKRYDEQIAQLYDFFEQAKAYQQLKNPKESNIRFEAMKGLFSGEKKLFVHVNSAREIMAVVDFKKRFDLDVVLVGAREAYMVADMLKENNIPVIVGSIHSLPYRPEDDVDLIYKLPAILKEAGVDFCFSMGGSWDQRNLPFVAGNAVAYGLEKEEALMALTSSTARILGLDKTLGTLEKGKDATLVVSSGDILDMKSSKIKYAFIQGRVINLDNKQKMLYRKFEKKYE